MQKFANTLSGHRGGKTMVYLNRIYTKSGDRGETSLGDGVRVPKTHPRIIACGAVDELNSLLGVALTVELPELFADRLGQIQNDLFDVGADLCVPESERSAERPPLRVTESQVARLERWIDDVNEQLQPLESFILPGGTAAAAHLHHARTVCRRAESNVVALSHGEPLNSQVLTYLNRLSDVLFVLARASNRLGTGDRLWEPGRDASKT